MPNTAEIIEFATAAERWLAQVRPILLRHFRHKMTITTKPDASPVTIADCAAEEFLRERINAEFPGHGVIGEEFGTSQTNEDYKWVIDPIDGTRSFISGRPWFGSLLALTYQGQPILGLIDMPALDERWVGGSGLPTRLNGRLVRTRSCMNINVAQLSATTPAMFSLESAAAFGRVADQVQSVVYGGDCYNYALVAAGWSDIVIEADLKPYDFLAPAAIITAAGGVMKDWQGDPLTLGSGSHVIAAGDSALLPELLKQLNSSS